MKQYLAAMAVRTLSFPVAVWAFATERYVLATVAAVLATIIPSFAVMLANAVDRRQQPGAATPASPVQGLGPAGGASDQAADRADQRAGDVAGPGGPAGSPNRPAGRPDEPASPRASGEVITGTVVRSRDTPHRAGATPGPPPREAAS